MQPASPQFDETQHGVVLNDGTKVPFSQLKETDPLLYKQYIQNVAQPAQELQQSQSSTQATQAQIPGIQATSQADIIKAQQTAALKNLGNDLQNKMTLKGAIKKYTSLGMKADDIFKQYLGQSPYGMPNENPTELQNLGVTPDALGRIGDPGSFMDRFNTKNSISELRGLQDTFNKTSGAARIPVLGNLFDKAYNAQKLAVADHLSSLIPGASQGQTSNQSFLNSLPDPSNPASVSQADDIFNKIETTLLQSKGYTTQQLGLPPRSVSTQQQAKADPKGGDILSNLMKDVSGMNESMQANPSTQLVGGPLATLLNPQAVGKAVDQGVSTLPGIMGEYAHASGAIDKNGNVAKSGSDVLMNMIEHAKDHPGNTAMDLLPLLGLKRGDVSLGAGEAGAGEAVKSPPSEPGGLQQLLTPGKSKNVIGQIRDNIIQTADKTGNTVNGDSLAQGIRSWADNAKLSNLPDSDAIEAAAANAEKLYAGKSFKPSELKGIYDGIEKGYTTNGQPRTATSSYIDRGIKSVISDQLDQAAPGFKRTSQLFDQTYKAEKSPIRAAGKNAIKYGIPLLGAGEAGNLINHIIFGH